MSIWIDDFKIAVINEDLQQIINLYEQMPDCLSVHEMMQAKSLLDASILLLENEREKTSKFLQALQKAKQYSGVFKANTLGFSDKF